jgi:hypothetical protein
MIIINFYLTLKRNSSRWQREKGDVPFGAKDAKSQIRIMRAKLLPVTNTS